MQSCFFFVDADGTENVSNIMPTRHDSEPFWVIIKKKIIYDESCHHDIVSKTVCYDDITELPKGTIKQLFGVELKWEDKPIKIDWNDHDTKPLQIETSL